MFTVVLDACVLVPPTLCDTLLRIAAERGGFGVRWSPEILDEVTRAMQRHGQSAPAAERRIQSMRSAFPHAEVLRCTEVAPLMTNDPGDRHVLAAAVLSGCDTIVTANLKHFGREALMPWGVEAVPPDEFLLNQLDLVPGIVRTAIEQQSAAYTNPPMTPGDILGTLSRTGLARFADEARRQWPD